MAHHNIFQYINMPCCSTCQANPTMDHTKPIDQRPRFIGSSGMLYPLDDLQRNVDYEKVVIVAGLLYLISPVIRI